MTSPLRRDCDDARALASAALDVPLSEFERRVLDAHVRTCPECAGFQERARGVTALVRSTPAEEPSTGLWQRPRRPARRVGRVAAMATALAAASALGAYAAGPLSGGGDHARQAKPLLVAERPGLAREFRIIRALPEPFHQAGRRWSRTQFLA
jgi:hypothetical protein